MVPVLQQFFERNEILVYFAYGLVFFVLGVAVALQSRRHSHLELARGLGWLSAFGIAHGFYEWGSIFIPIQATYLAEPVITFLNSLHVVLLALSFGFLFQFGVELLRERWPRSVILPLAAVATWMFLFFMPGLAYRAGDPSWHQLAVIWARYLIGFPAGLSAALGLRFQAEQQIKPMQMQGIYSTLRIAGVALAAYAILGGLFVPEANFFPASWLNEVRLLDWVGIPAPVFRSLAGFALSVSMIRALEVFDLEVDRMIEQMGVERNLALERERIGRELHDGTIQTIYTAGLLIEAALQKLPPEDKSAKHLHRSMDVLNEAIASLRAYIDGLRPSPANRALADAIRDFALNARWDSLIEIELNIDLPQDATLSQTRVEQVLLILNEALSNAARHSGAHRVSIDARRSEDRFSLVIQDDGLGIRDKNNGKGYGLRNMRDRARLLGGSLAVESKPDKGTTILLTAPWEIEE